MLLLLNKYYCWQGSSAAVASCLDGVLIFFENRAPAEEKPSPPKLRDFCCSSVSGFLPRRGAQNRCCCDGVNLCSREQIFIFPVKNRVRGACLRVSFGATIQKWCSCLSGVHISEHEQEGLFRYLAVGFTGPGWEGHGLESAVLQRRGAHFYRKRCFCLNEVHISGSWVESVP